MYYFPLEQEDFQVSKKDTCIIACHKDKTYLANEFMEIYFRMYTQNMTTSKLYEDTHTHIWNQIEKSIMVKRGCNLLTCIENAAFIML